MNECSSSDDEEIKQQTTFVIHESNASVSLGLDESLRPPAMESCLKLKPGSRDSPANLKGGDQSTHLLNTTFAKALGISRAGPLGTDQTKLIEPSLNSSFMMVKKRLDNLGLKEQAQGKRNKSNLTLALTKNLLNTYTKIRRQVK